MTEFFGIPAATYEQLGADHIAAERARQLDNAVYAQALTDPEACERYRHDLGFRMQIDLTRQNLHAMDRALVDEGAAPEQRNRVLQRLITGREPYRGLDIALGWDAPITVPHGPFGITVGDAAIVDGQLRHATAVVSCACGRARTWDRAVSGGELLAWLSDHPAQKDQHEQNRRRGPSGRAASAMPTTPTTTPHGD